MYDLTCEHCKSPYQRRRQTRFCSLKCSAGVQKKEAEGVASCAQCGKEIRRAAKRLAIPVSGLSFCDRVCKALAQRVEGGQPDVQPPHYGTGKTIYRPRAFKAYGKVCLNCGYSRHERMLDVHHIDSDRSNNELDNLVVLCVWCHGLETRGVEHHMPTD